MTLLFSFSVIAKKKEPQCPGGLKKIVAVGPVDSGYFSFENSDPTSLSKLLQNQLRQEIEAKGCAVGFLQEPPPQEEAAPVEMAVTPETDLAVASPSVEPLPPPKDPQKMSPAEAMALMQQSQQMMAQMMQMAAQGMRAGGSSGPAFKPVAAQALVRAKVSTSEGGFDTGGAADVAGIFFEGAGVASFSSKSYHVTLECIALDPQKGTLLDHTTIKTKSSQLGRIAGMEAYYYEDSGDQQKAYERLFQKGIKKCADWVSGRMKEKWEGLVIKVDGARVFLNAGSRAGVQKGMQFQLIQKEAVVAGQGVQFGSEEQWAGLLEVDEVQEGYSVAHLNVGGPAIVGQILHLMTAFPK